MHACAEKGVRRDPPARRGRDQRMYEATLYWTPGARKQIAFRTMVFPGIVFRTSLPELGRSHPVSLALKLASRFLGPMRAPPPAIEFFPLKMHLWRAKRPVFARGAFGAGFRPP